MALEGSLKEFSLADILQLLYFQKKTGVLILQGRQDKVRLHFNKGNIVGAESRKRDAENRLGRVLVKRGVVTAQQLQAAVEKQKSEGRKFGAVLVNEGYATPEQVQEVITFQINEALAQLFSWQEGKYEFVPQSIPMDNDIGVSLDTQHVLMEGLRLVDEWSQLKGRVDIETVFERRDSASYEPSPEEEKVLAYVDGENDVAAVAELSGVDSFQVSVLLLGLMDKKVVKKKILDETTQMFAAPPRRVRRIPGLAFFLMVLTMAALAVSVLVFLRYPSDLRLHEAGQQLYALRLTAETSKVRTGTYPPSLKATDPWGTPVLYAREGRGFVIKSAGPDGKPGTADDLP
ncbi:MAG: DUF4388 domain-containing protein [Nitrospirota bacterium]|jgi:hypothetical protein